MTDSEIIDRLAAVESLVEDQQETIDSQQETIERQQETIAELESSGGIGISRRGTLLAGGALGLLGLGAGSAGAQTTPSGKVGTDEKPLEALNTLEVHAPESSLTVTTGPEETDPGGENSGHAAGNIVTGYAGNDVSGEAVGSVIGGGGGDVESTPKKSESAGPNFIEADFSVIGGGTANQIGPAADGGSVIGGGVENEVEADFGTIAGGLYNHASGIGPVVNGGWGNFANGSFFSTVGGGEFNSATSGHATVGGGENNMADAQHATVGGGYSNSASAEGATVAGGLENAANGAASFAAGSNATADHDGSFVVGDSSDTGVQSQAADEARFQTTLAAQRGLIVGQRGAPASGEFGANEALLYVSDGSDAHEAGDLVVATQDGGTVSTESVDTTAPAT